MNCPFPSFSRSESHNNSPEYNRGILVHPTASPLLLLLFSPFLFSSCASRSTFLKAQIARTSGHLYLDSLHYADCCCCCCCRVLAPKDGTETSGIFHDVLNAVLMARRCCSRPGRSQRVHHAYSPSSCVFNFSYVASV